MFDVFIDGLIQFFAWETFLFMNIGILIGIIFGAIPGLTGNLGIIIFLPFSFSMDPQTSIIFLMAIFIGGEFGGSISSILIGIPGTNAAVATMLDGYPLTQQGHGKKTLITALLASAVGGTISGILLLVAAPTIANFTVNFGPPEYFALTLFGISVVAGISGRNLAAGIISGSIGVLLSLVGMDTVSGSQRFTFGVTELMSGLPLLPLLIGVFAVPSIIEQLDATNSSKKEESKKVLINSKSKDPLTKKDVKKVTPTILQGSFIGSFIGAIPGAGASIAAFMSYDQAKRSSKTPQKFGKGEIKGVVASESANNAVTAASLIPLLSLGIPGSPSAAVLLGAFMVQGMEPGPTLFENQGVILYAIMIGIIVTSFFMFIQGRILSKYLVKVTNVPYQVMVPLLVLMCTAGAFAANNSVFGMQVFIIVGIVAFILKKLNFPLVPIVLGFVLGPLLEFNLRRSLVMSQGSWDIFITRPISLAFIAMTTIFLIYTLKKNKEQEN
ncbi:tripartite tricarboxylate transporter permease [Lentibacillus sediminis]|uniref:tripartite tricarboxylate transporter permease n=1 Tax=Lentibacillus sediminis TaxID=1940529 RepID=UPI00195D4B47|nr:tripartite tricarboxylate transporter permease [Lentibacillus sediminis]